MAEGHPFVSWRALARSGLLGLARVRPLAGVLVLFGVRDLRVGIQVTQGRESAHVFAFDGSFAVALHWHSADVAPPLQELLEAVHICEGDTLLFVLSCADDVFHVLLTTIHLHTVDYVQPAVGWQQRQKYGVFLVDFDFLQLITE